MQGTCGIRRVITVVLPPDCGRRTTEAVLALIEGAVPVGSKISYTDADGRVHELLTQPETVIGRRIRQEVEVPRRRATDVVKDEEASG